MQYAIHDTRYAIHDLLDRIPTALVKRITTQDAPERQTAAMG